MVVPFRFAAALSHRREHLLGRGVANHAVANERQ